MNTARSGVPPLETCLLCHSRIIVDHPEIVKLRAYYDAGKPVEWVRVNDLPDFVYFDHSAHVRAGFDCGRCHGDVAGMDRVWLVHDFQMGFCVQCHRDNGFSHDCLICHR
jgi:predicted CXXCH cytochrome family protein